MMIDHRDVCLGCSNDLSLLTFYFYKRRTGEESSSALILVGLRPSKLLKKENKNQIFAKIFDLYTLSRGRYFGHAYSLEELSKPVNIQMATI